MNPAYLPLLDAAHARLEGETLHSFGDPRAELAAGESGSVIVPLVHLGLIRVAGDEAAIFLHNLLSNDVKGLAATGARLNSFCTPKGRMLTSFLMWRDASGAILLQPAADIAAGLQKKLTMYVLRSKAKVSDAAGDTCQFGLAGPQASRALQSCGLAVPEAALGVAHSGEATVIRLDAARLIVAVPAAAAAAQFGALTATGMVAAGTAVWQALDIRAGWPLITAATQEEFVPQMANFELLGGVSFNKGCYPGQEIVARTQYLGKLKKRMYRAFVAGGDLPASATDLYSPDVGEQSCGKVVTASRLAGGGCELLAVMQMSSHDGNDVHLGTPGGPKLEFRPLPYAVS
jgi:folate-binding protein YgfZ